MSTTHDRSEARRRTPLAPGLSALIDPETGRRFGEAPPQPKWHSPGGNHKKVSPDQHQRLSAGTVILDGGDLAEEDELPPEAILPFRRFTAAIVNAGPCKALVFADQVYRLLEACRWHCMIASEQQILRDRVFEVAAQHNYCDLPVDEYEKIAGDLEAGVRRMWLAAVERISKAEEAKPAGGTRLIRSSAEFVSGFVPPDYSIEGLIQRRFCYSMTGKTGAGKTSVLLVMAACKPLGRPLGWPASPQYAMEPGRVLYCAGENPDDIRMRWIAMSQHYDFDIDTIDVHFIEGVVKLSAMRDRIREELQRLPDDRGVSLVIVDTNSAFFEGSDENDNVQALTQAKLLRSFTTMPGAPTVLAACHPVKNASDDNLVPRGGGAFVNEMDGNLVARKIGQGSCELYWQVKFRGPDFHPVSFSTKSVTHERLRDSRGRLIPTVTASYLSETAQEEMENIARFEQQALLKTLADNPDASRPELARILGWKMNNGEPYKQKVVRNLQELEKQGLVDLVSGTQTLTPKGKKFAQNDCSAKPRPNGD